MSESSEPPSANKGELRLLTMALIVIVSVIVLRFLFTLANFPTSVHGVILRVPFEVTLSSVVMMVVFWFDSNIYIRKHYVGVSDYGYALASMILVVVVIGSIVLHEFGHGLVAWILGHGIDHAGLTYWGAYVAPKESFFEMSPFDQAAISIAGPGVNCLIAAVAVFWIKILGESLFENGIQYVGYVNIRLARLNLFPIIFLDGGKTLDAFLRFLISDINIRMVFELGVFIVFVYFYRRYRKTHEPYEDSLSQM